MMYKLYSISIFIFIVSGCRTTQSGVKDLGDTDGIVIERNKSYGSEGYKVTCDFGLRGKIVRAVVWKEELEKTDKICDWDWLHKLNPDRLYSLAYSPYHPNSEKQYYFSFFVGRSAKDELFVTPLGISDSPTSTQSQVRSQEQETRKVDKFDLELGRLSASTENKRDFCKTWVHDSRRNNMDRATIDKTYHTQIKLCADGQSVQLFDDFYKYTSEGNEKYFTGKAKSTIVDINALSLPFESKRYLDANKL